MAGPVSEWRLRTKTLNIESGVLMGVVNVTPDSFSDGGRFGSVEQAVAYGQKLVADGAQIIDVGGESTRPGATPVSVKEELRRVAPVVSGLTASGAVVSVDTSKPEVAEAALAAGAEIVNDVTACQTDGMAQLVAGSNAGVVLVHMSGTPVDMQVDPRYDDVVTEIAQFLEEQTQRLIALGVDGSRISIDPGIGFGKTVEHNLKILNGLAQLSDLPFPLVLGTSRKKFLSVVSGADSLEERDWATAVTTALGFAYGARVFRVHNVIASRCALGLAAAIVKPQWDEWLPD